MKINVQLVQFEKMYNQRKMLSNIISFLHEKKLKSRYVICIFLFILLNEMKIV